MKRILLPLLLVLLLLGCAAGNEPGAEETTVPTLPEATVPAEVTAREEVQKHEVTCRESYTGTVEPNELVATVGNRHLKNGELQVWYWAEVAQYRREQHETAPDFGQPLDQQACGIDSSVDTWQQYFLKQALMRWHTAQLLIAQSESIPMPTEEAYQPRWSDHYRMENMPVEKYLYGHNIYYQVNTLHQQYLDALPDTLQQLAQARGYRDTAAMAGEAFGATEADLMAYAQSNNRGYMYFTAMSYYIEPTQEELTAYYEANWADSGAGERTVDIRHILLVPQDIVQEPEKKRNSRNTEPTDPVILEEVEIAPDGRVICSEEAWRICRTYGQDLLTWWKVSKGASEGAFAEIANKTSYDTGTRLDGGAYYGLRRGQLIEELDTWCFAPTRKPGDSVLLRTPYGIHLLYFSGSSTTTQAAAREDYFRQQQTRLLHEARAQQPMVVHYPGITLGSCEPSVAAEDILYQDVAHERYPEIPLYLQQDYPTTMYGNYPIRSHGCGITTMAMLASYMADDELTPPEMCARFGDYCYSTGTDGSLFTNEPCGMGFYLREKTYDVHAAKAALVEGQIVISCQHRGYWTNGGHYIALERITEDGKIQVRDSNLYNYVKLVAHRVDKHSWVDIITDGTGYWIFEDKVVSIPICSRCGGEYSGSPLLVQYTCHKCIVALRRRTTYLSGSLELPDYPNAPMHLIAQYTNLPE